MPTKCFMVDETDEAAKKQPTAGESAHGGAAQKIEPIDQHQADLTGGLPGVGAR